MLRSRLSSIVLIAANLIPLCGVLFYEWDASFVLALFWIENLIIGGFNMLKMLLVVLRSSAWSKLLLIGFFVLHYGIFWIGHGLLLWKLLGFESLQASQYFGREFDGFLALGADGMAIMLSFISLHSPYILLAIAGLVMSHLVSFIEHFILRGEVFKHDVDGLMMLPYKNVVIMHAGLLGGAFLLNYFQSPVWLLAVIVVLKILYDVRSHAKRHSYLEGPL